MVAIHTQLLSDGIQPDDSLILASAADTLELYSSHVMPPGIQRVVTKLIEDQIDTTRLNRMRAARDRLGLARTHAARAPLSAAWLVAIPDNPLLSMSSIQMKIILELQKPC